VMLTLRTQMGYGLAPPEEERFGVPELPHVQADRLHPEPVV
jgi:hypothetical protein